jgi:hypothetical protein
MNIAFPYSACDYTRMSVDRHRNFINVGCIPLLARWTIVYMALVGAGNFSSRLQSDACLVVGLHIRTLALKVWFCVLMVLPGDMLSRYKGGKCFTSLQTTAAFADWHAWQGQF